MSMIIDGTNGVTFPNSTVQAAAYVGFSTVFFTSSTTWAVPSGVTRARITVIGGGGAGRTTATAATGGAGGAAIAYCTGISGTLTITVGVGKAGDSGLAGGTSSITGTGVSISATGGGPGLSGVSGTDGVGTVTTGTALRTQDAGVINVITDGQSMTTAGLGSAAQTYSASSIFGAGFPGTSSAAGSGSACGVVMIEY